MTNWSLTGWGSSVTLNIKAGLISIYLSIYIYVHKYKYIYLRTLFFLFEELLSPLSGVKYRISTNEIQVIANYFFNIVLGVIVLALYPKY